MSVLFSVPYALCSSRISSCLWTAVALACAQKSLRCYLLYLSELQLHRGRAAKDRDHHFQRLAIFVHFVHRAVEIRKRPIGDADSLILFELHANLGFVLAHVHAIDNLVDLIFSQRRWIVCSTHKTRYARRRFHHMPHV